MMRIFSASVLAFMVLTLVGGCEVNLHGTHNSSQGENDYFEEPITERSIKYSAALETSNSFIHSFAKGQLADARGFLDPRLQEVVSEQEFASLHEQVQANFGSFVEYKPMQWGFTTTSQLPNTVVSTKIVIHENSETFYVFNFEDDGVYDHIIGFNITPRADGERVAQGASRARGLN